ncbi:MAG: NAD-dependent epimerase/dehydratase family protein [archaeon]|nr:NAD-dependent epimerase/dehydratase family protein [archaeon]
MGSHKIISEDLEEISNEIRDISHKLNGETIFIAGGAGFLGKYLVSTLDYLNKNSLEKPCKVIVADNFITGLERKIEENENISVIKQDISKEFILEGDVDYIIHAASLASPKFYNKFRLETINAGFLGTRNLLEIAKEKNVKNFLFFSSSEVYGDPDSKFIPTPEEYRGNVSCNGPRSCYDEPKRIGETLCVNYGDIHNIPIKIVRPFNVYGPGMRLDDGRVIPNFVSSAINGEKITMYGDGDQTRTFCYISDATSGWIKALLSSESERIFNIGNDDQEIKMKHLGDLVLGLVGNKNSSVEYKEDKMGVYGNKSDPSRRCPDLTKSRNILHYNPKVNLVFGIKRFIKWAEDEILVNKK